MRSISQLLFVAGACCTPAICFSQLSGTVEFSDQTVNNLPGDVYSGPGDELYAAVPVTVSAGPNGSTLNETFHWLHELPTMTSMGILIDPNTTVGYIRRSGRIVTNPAFAYTAFTDMLYEQVEPPDPSRYLDAGISIPFTQGNGGGPGGGGQGGGEGG